MSLRKTKIIATLGPATERTEVIGALIGAGANVFRLNMSHAAHPWVRDVVSRVREEAASRGASVATLLDLQGPSIRTGDLAEKWSLPVGAAVEFRQESLAPAAEFSVTTNYDGLHEDISVGDVMLVDNGVIHFRVDRIELGRVFCQTLTEGLLGSRRHINLPGIRVNLPSLTEKDFHDIDLAAELALDYVAISFVRDAAHVAQLRAELTKRGCQARIVAKIEDQEAVKHITEIIRESDAVMVARGDLGIEVHVEELPVVQRQILREAARIGRKVIVATHMLESMIENPGPTRAEVTDVANAVFEQADAVMLSGETSVGHYPVKCIEVLDRIARRMEREPGARFASALDLGSERQATLGAAVQLAESNEDSHLMVFTKRGGIANDLAMFRPEHSSIFAFCPDHQVLRSLSLNRAVTALPLEFSGAPEDIIREAIGMLQERGFVKKGDRLVVLSEVLHTFDAEAILVRRV